MLALASPGLVLGVPCSLWPPIRTAKLNRDCCRFGSSSLLLNSKPPSHPSAALAWRWVGLAARTDLSVRQRGLGPRADPCHGRHHRKRGRYRQHAAHSSCVTLAIGKSTYTGLPTFAWADWPRSCYRDCQHTSRETWLTPLPGFAIGRVGGGSLERLCGHGNVEIAG